MSILLDHPVKGHSPSILVPYESWIYLRNICKIQRTGKETSEKYREKMKRAFEDNDGVIIDHKKRLINSDFGGAIGAPENSWEEHRWTSWSVEQMKAMLDEAGLPYEDGEEVEFISV